MTQSLSPPESGSRINVTANGGSASEAPLINAPIPACSVNQPEVRSCASHERVGPSANRSAGTPHRAFARATASGLVSGNNSAVTAAIGSATPYAPNWRARESENMLLAPTSGPTITVPTSQYGINRAPPRIRWSQRSLARVPNRARADTLRALFTRRAAAGMRRCR